MGRTEAVERSLCFQGKGGTFSKVLRQGNEGGELRRVIRQNPRGEDIKIRKRCSKGYERVAVQARLESYENDEVF